MVGEKHKHLVVCGQLEHLLAFGCSGIALDDCEEVLRSDICTRIIDLDPAVHINSGALVSRLVEHFAFEGVHNIVGDVVVGEGDDVIPIKATSDQCLVGMEDISLVPVVGVSVGACYKECPLG